MLHISNEVIHHTHGISWKGVEVQRNLKEWKLFILTKKEYYNAAAKMLMYIFPYIYIYMEKDIYIYKTFGVIVWSWHKLFSLSLSFLLFNVRTGEVVSMIMAI